MSIERVLIGAMHGKTYCVYQMVDITDYTVGANEAYTHIACINDDVCYMNVPDTDTILQMATDAIDEEYDLYEVIDEVCIPHVVFNGDPMVGVQCLYAIMKRLYNHSGCIVILSNTDRKSPVIDGKYIICAPYTRVNRDMLSEIMETFNILCKYRDIEYNPVSAKYLPLTWDVSAYRECTEIDISIAFNDAPATVLSARISSEPIATKVKMNAAQSKKAALIDSIIMYSREEIKGDMKKAAELVPLISKDRSRDMSLFLAMGRCLYRIYRGDGAGLELWRDACVQQVQPLCDEYWPTLDTTCTYYRIYTLQYWASKDSPDQYREWNSTSVRAALEASVMATGGILDVATVAYRKNPTLFICEGDDAKDAIFFRFNGTYYKPCGMFALQDYLDSDIITEYDDYLSDMSKLLQANAAAQGNDTSFIEMMQKKIDKCINIIVKLKSDSFQVSVVKCLMRLYNKEGFDLIRDSNPYLTAFEDCVFDAERKCIRDGIPEDCLTCSTGYDFKEAFNTYSLSHPHVQLVLDNIKKIVHDPEKEELLRRENASLLHACNPLKRGLTVHGPTNNGKSILYSWLGKALGSTYCPDVPNNLFYSIDAHPGGATPHMEMARFARLVVQSEVDDSMTLNEALFKRWTGGTDKITYRGLYKSKIKAFVPRSKPVTVCNTFAKINGNSAALRTRMVVLALDSKFITEKDPEYDHIKHMTYEERDQYMKDNHWYWADIHFDRTIESTYKAFMWLMIDDYIRYSSDGIVPMKILPESVQRDTVNYFIKSNIFLQFIRQATRRHPDAPGVTTYTMYNAYKKWYQDTIARTGFAALSKFLDELASMGYRHNNDVYCGIVITYQ